ncbi:helix-turn-helix domain-containing protein [Polaribacter sp. IC073]|nr:helix-turn-helix domain-containing protein [Polaribacter sp. IC073]
MFDRTFLTGFIRSICLKKAAELILLENKKLSIVAIQVEFNDYKYFGYKFKKQFGCLPSKYKSMKKP